MTEHGGCKIVSSRERYEIPLCRFYVRRMVHILESELRVPLHAQRADPARYGSTTGLAIRNPEPKSVGDS
jgi:hypothetical protein